MFPRKHVWNSKKHCSSTDAQCFLLGSSVKRCCSPCVSCPDRAWPQVGVTGSPQAGCSVGHRDSETHSRTQTAEYRSWFAQSVFSWCLRGLCLQECKWTACIATVNSEVSYPYASPSEMPYGTGMAVLCHISGSLREWHTGCYLSYDPLYSVYSVCSLSVQIGGAMDLPVGGITTQRPTCHHTKPSDPLK